MLLFKRRFWRLLCRICQIQSSRPFDAVGEALSEVPGWLQGFHCWLFDRFGIDLSTILESFSIFSLVLLSPFYGTVFDAQRSLVSSCDPPSGAQPIVVVQILALGCLKSLVGWLTSVF